MAPLAVASNSFLSLSARLPLNVQVGLRAGYVQRIEMDEGMVERGVQASLALQRNAGHSDRQLLDARLASQFLGPRQRSLDGDRSGQRGFPAKALHMSQLERARRCSSVKTQLSCFGSICRR